MKPATLARTLLLGAAATLAVLHCLRFADFWVDDAAISFVYSRSFAHGHGLVFFPGGERVEGYSNFLWTVLLGGGMALGSDVWLLAHVLGAAAAAAAALLAAELVAAVRGRRSPLDAAAAFVVAGLTPVPYFSMSGLECGLYVALVTGCAVATVRERARPGFPWSAACAAALALTRPDGASMLLVAAAARLLGRRRPRELALWAAVAFLPVAAFVAWRWSYYGWPLPNTFYAKSGHTSSLSDLVRWGSEGWLYARNLGDRYMLVPPFIAAAVALLRRHGWLDRLLAGSFGLAVLAFAVYSGGDWMSEGRFVMPALPILIALALDGCENAARLAREVRAGPLARCLLALAIFAAVTAATVRASVRRSRERTGSYPVPAKALAPRGEEYRRLARAFDVARPTAIEGNVGGVAMVNEDVELWDLGALTDAPIAHGGGHPSVLYQTTFDERRPDFIFAGSVFRGILPDFPEFPEMYLPLPARRWPLSDMYIARRLLVADGLDTRKPLAALAPAGVDVVGAEVHGTDVRLWLLVRAAGRRARITLAGSPLSIAEDLYGPGRWRPGDVVRVHVKRPAWAPPAVCAGASCVALVEGRQGSLPLPLPPPEPELLARADAAGDLLLAADLRRRLGQPARPQAAALEARAAAEDADAAFRDLRAALAADPERSSARRKLEKLRLAPRAAYGARFDLRLDAALRAFQLDPTPATLDAVAAAAAAAGRPEPLARAHLATGIAPDAEAARLELAEALVAVGLGARAAALLPLTGDAARVYRVVRLAGGDAELRSDRSVAVAPGLELIRAWADAGPDDAVDLRLALRGAGDKLRVGGRELPIQRLGDVGFVATRLALPPGSQTVAAGTATLRISHDPLSGDFEDGRLDGWSASGDGFAVVPWPGSLATFGFRGTRLLGSLSGGVGPTGTLISQRLRREVDELCARVAGGGTQDGVRLVVRDGKRQLASFAGRGDRVLRDGCWPLGPGADRRIVVEDNGREKVGFILVDDVECLAGGRPTPCLGAVTVAY